MKISTFVSTATVALVLLTIAETEAEAAFATYPQPNTHKTKVTEVAPRRNTEQKLTSAGRQTTDVEERKAEEKCVLCGQQAIAQTVVSGRAQSAEFETCCSEQDFSAQGNCTGVEEISRVVVFDRPFVRSSEDEAFFHISKVAFTNSEIVQCCSTCSCSGNFCRTFNNTIVSTLPCDARTTRRDCFGNEICVFDRELCLELTDPNGEPCAWDPEEPSIVPDDFCPLEYEPQGLRLASNPPCKPRVPVRTVLFQISPFLPSIDRRRALQIVGDPVLTVSSETAFDGYTLVLEVEDGPTIRIRASDCVDETKLNCVDGVLVQHQQEFDMDDVTCLRERTVQNSGQTIIDDWTIYYDSVEVPVEFSCQVSTVNVEEVDDDNNGDDDFDFRMLQEGRVNVTGSQLQLEAISIPESLDRRFKLDGICADPSLAKTVQNSDSTCAADVAIKPEEEVIAQAICQQESLESDVTRSSFGLQDDPFAEFSCIKDTFCSRFARPFFPSTDACFDCFLVRRDVRFCFCNAVVRNNDEDERRKEVEECIEKVATRGWKGTVGEYLQELTTFLPRPSENAGENIAEEDGTCVRSFDQLNDTLGACEEGVFLEVYDVEFERWRVLKAFPASVPFCKDANFSVYSSESSTFALTLMSNRVRFRQAYRSECYRCKPRLGVDIEYDLQVQAEPTRMPTGTPTKWPTSSPSKAAQAGWLRAWTG